MTGLRFRLFRTESFKLAALLAALFIASSIVLTGAMYLVAAKTFNEDFERSVQNNMAAVEEAYRNEGIPEVIEVIRQLTASGVRNDYYLLQDPSGEKLAGNLPAMKPDLGDVSVKARRAKEHKVIGEGKLLPDGSYVFVGADSFRHTQVREHILFTFMLITGITLALALGGGILLSAGAMKRTDAIIDVCDAIAANRWDRRIPLTLAGTESDLLAATINGMLDKLAALMENLRQVSSDIAHDLRTPLTHLRQRLERAQIEAKSPAEYNAAMERALADSDEILAIFSSLLSLSQIEAGMRPANSETVDVSALLTHLADTYRPVADDHGQRLTVDVTPGVTAIGDRALLMQMFSNLIENAIRHCPKSAEIAVTLVPGLARIADTGPGIPEADREKAFHRFWRGESSRGSPGHGLGMSIVAAIAGLHRIAISLADNKPGLVVELHLNTLSRLREREGPIA